jgi:hypothetical protein
MRYSTHEAGLGGGLSKQMLKIELQPLNFLAENVGHTPE